MGVDISEKSNKDKENNSNDKIKTKTKKQTKKNKNKSDIKKDESISTGNRKDVDVSVTYIPGMKGTIRPETPITIKQSKEEIELQEQAEEFYRLQMEQQQLFEKQQ